VIEAHLDMGNVAEARRQFELCRNYLRHNLGLDPSPALLSLFESRGQAPVAVPRVRPYHSRS